jgi:adenine C2-methylase RlmN of 23S rRNA A2503 and tRNA A37
VLLLSLQALMQDCAAYFKATGRRVTFEYTLMSGTNDEPEHVSSTCMHMSTAETP